MTTMLDPSTNGHSGGATRPTSSCWIGSEDIAFPSRGLPRTAMDWEVNPDGLRKLLVRLGEEYPALPPLYVTENGAAYDDVVSDDGAVHDTERTEFVLGHIAAVGEAIDQGADVRGYFVWSLLDNFEWAYGYGKRFGLVRCYAPRARRYPDNSVNMGTAYDCFDPRANTLMQALTLQPHVGFGLVGGIVLLVILFVAYYCGGYVAGRMARFHGARQGFAVWVWALVIAIVVHRWGLAVGIIGG